MSNLENEKELKSVSGEVVDTTEDYIATINQLKQNSVERSKYDQLRAENKRLLDSIVNGQSVEIAQPKVKKDINVLRNELFNGENTNLSYITKTLELRDALMENGEMDPFLPSGNQIAPTDEDVKTANKVAEVLKECVEYAEGDNSVFTNELQRRMIDVRIR